MKKNFLYAMMSAIALTGAVCVSSCSSSEEIVDNPDYNPVDNTVKTQFAFSLSNGGAKSLTRQTLDVVQGDDPSNPIRHNKFRGMTKMTLIPFGGTEEVTTSSDLLGSPIGPLTMVSTATTPSSSSSYYDSENNDAVVYTNITVPNSTTHFLFYGQATDETSTDNEDLDDDLKFVNGALTVSGLYTNPYSETNTYNFASLNSVYFEPTQILNTSATDYSTKAGVGTNVIGLLNDLLTVTDNGETTGNKWVAYTTGTLQQSLLKDLYTAYTQLTTGSSYSVAAMLVDLYSSLEGLAGTAEGTAGRTMAIALRSKIAEGFNTTVAEANFKYLGYPGNLGMPDGAAKLTFDSTNGFAFADPNVGNYPTTPNPNPTTISVTSYADYVYPANLQYFVNSDIVVSDVQQSGSFSTQNSWDDCTGLYKAGTKVTSTTKSVALVKEIQYAVGNLKTVVNALSGTTYYDRKAQEIDLTTNTTNPFILTGVLVGSQGQVGWNFLPATAGSKTIYDKDINSGTLTTSTAATNYTLGLQTVDAPATADNTTGVVYIALELKNNTGKDFVGKDGLIPAGGKFYLAGKLDPFSLQTGTVKSVFKQDYVTTANITILAGTPADSDGDSINDSATGGFAEATNGVPDLRTPQSEVCFSVNLQWQSGLTFNVNM